MDGIYRGIVGGAESDALRIFVVVIISDFRYNDSRFEFRASYDIRKEVSGDKAVEPR